jgi:hypothetical protein
MTTHQQLEQSVALERAKDTQLAPSATPMGILEIAISKGADIDQLTKLLELKERWDAGEARKAFNKAFSAFKSESVRIVKNVSVSDGPLKGKKYADLFGVVSAVTPVLAKHELSHSWKLTRDEKDWMEVTCTISHSLGHSESVSMGAAPDTGPGRNAIQARGSAKSYLERYTLLAATGFAAADVDNDGNTITGKPPVKEMDPREFARYSELIENAQGLPILDTTYQAACADAGEDSAAKSQFKAAAGKRFRELSGQ